MVLVPIHNELKSIKSGVNTIAEVMHLNSNIVVIATKLKKRNKHDIFDDWPQCEDMLNIQQAVHSQISSDIPVLPLKFSAVFDTLFEEEKSIAQLMQGSGLANYQYKEVNDQFNAIYHLIDTRYAK